MANIRVDFGFFNGMKPEYIREGKITSGFRYVGTHMIFDIKMDGKFTCKARLLSGRQKTSPPLSITYSSFVTRESFRLAFLTSGINYIYIFDRDIGNEYLNAPCWEKCGPKQDQNLGVIKYAFS